MIAALDAGAAWTPYLAGSHTGRVLATFRQAIYLQFDSDVVALVVAEVASGPVHLRLSDLPPWEAGRSVVLHATIPGRVHLRSTSNRSPNAIEFDRPRAWRPPPINTGLLRQVRPTWTAAKRSELSDTAVIREVRQLLTEGKLSETAARLAGLGSGLTPAGDDVLAGVLVVDALTQCFTTVERVAVADSARTHDISRAFLRWAAIGQSLDPVHQLLAALVTQDQSGVERAQTEVAAIGGTSGADLLLGLEVGLCSQP